jgi:hypothetical protein
VLENQATIRVKVPVLGVVPLVLRYVPLRRAVLWVAVGVLAPVNIPKAKGQLGAVVVAGEVRLPETDRLSALAPGLRWHAQGPLRVFLPQRVPHVWRGRVYAPCWHRAGSVHYLHWIVLRYLSETLIKLLFYSSRMYAKLSAVRWV